MLHLTFAALLLAPMSSPSPLPASVLDYDATHAVATVTVPRIPPAPELHRETLLGDLTGLGPSHGDRCADRGVRPILVLAQIADSFVTANAVRRGSTGVRVFGNASVLGYVAETLLADLVIHRVERHASCGVRTATDALLTGAAINNAAQTEFPR